MENLKLNSSVRKCANMKQHLVLVFKFEKFRLLNIKVCFFLI